MNQKKARNARRLVAAVYRQQLIAWKSKRPKRWRFISFYIWKKRRPPAPNICEKTIKKVERKYG